MKKKKLYRWLAGAMAMALAIADVPAVRAEESDFAEAEETEVTLTEETEVSFAEEMDAIAASGYTVLKDENGKTYNLGGITVTVRDWWSDLSGEREPAYNDYMEARYAYLDWCQKTYNFKIKEQGISDWGSASADFVDYVTTGGDSNYYIFALRDDATTASSMLNGLMFDLSSLDCLNFNSAAYQGTKVHEKYTYRGNVYAMNGGTSEPGTGIYFNRRLLKEAGIDPDSIYNMQKNGTWTWSAWTTMLKKVQRDTNGDGAIDVYGVDMNYGVAVEAAVYSNNAQFVGMKDGLFTYQAESSASKEALQWVQDTMSTYGMKRPSGAQWDYYKEAFLNGKCAFMVEQAYATRMGNFLGNMTDDYGFVAFPKGTKASDYVNCWDNTLYAIPACYSGDKAWKIAFAYNLFASVVPGFEDYSDISVFYGDYKLDKRGLTETLPMMRKKGIIAYDSLIPNLYLEDDFLNKIQKGTNLTTLLSSVSSKWKNYITTANQSTVSFKITGQPASKSVKEEGKVTFKVIATGENLSYQWQKSTDGGNSWTNSGSYGNTTAKITMVAKASFNNMRFRCVIKDKSGKTYATNVVKLTVTSAATAPTITTQPTSQTVETGKPATFKVAASGTGLTYQWMKSSDKGTTWSNCGSTGATTATMSLTAKASYNGWKFKCVVKNSAGKSVTSNAVTLSVTTPLAITTQPTAATVTSGNTATFKVVATGDGVKYQWKISKDGGTSWANSGSTGATTGKLTLTAKLAFSGYKFKCVITDKRGNILESKAVTLTVKEAVKATAITTQPSSKTVTTMNNATFKIVATGDNLTYQWQKSVDGGKTWVNSGSTGAKTATLTISARLSMNGMKLKCIVSGKDGKTIESNVVTLTVKE